MLEDFPERLRRARERAEISARELDRLAELAYGHTSLIETRHRPRPEMKTAVKLAGVLGLSLDWLLSGIGTEPTAKQIRASVERARNTEAA
jgi:transcriptional regulator with XRE-family HTH domain